MREERTEVLVVGAGPVGLWTALLLAEAGVETIIIDREERTTARSYACALHPQTLARLQRLGLAQALLEQGRRVPTVAFYDHEARRAELRLSELGGDFPFLLILPQNALEHLLEERLRRAGVSVRWNHRFDSFTNEEELVAATVEKLGGTSTGYIVPHWETVVRDRWPVRAQFLLGANGHNSLVRQRLGIEYERIGGPEFFAAYEFVSEAPSEAEVRVVLDDATTNVLWPLPENRCRWTFQLLQSEIPAEFPDKERRAARLAQPPVDERIRQYVERVAQRRAPWFTAGVREDHVVYGGGVRAAVGAALGPEPLLAVGGCGPPNRPSGGPEHERRFCRSGSVGGFVAQNSAGRRPAGPAGGLQPPTGGAMAPTARRGGRAESRSRRRPVGAPAQRQNPAVLTGRRWRPAPLGRAVAPGLGLSRVPANAAGLVGENELFFSERF